MSANKHEEHLHTKYNISVSEVKDDEWEELGPDIAALHRLRGLSEHMFHERLQNASDQRYLEKCLDKYLRNNLMEFHFQKSQKSI